MVKRSVEQWLALFRQHYESGQLASVFCRDKGLCPKYFSNCKKVLNWRSGDISNKVTPAVDPKLIKVENRLKVDLKGLTIHSLILGGPGQCFR